MNNMTQELGILKLIKPSSAFIIGQNLVGQEGYEMVILDTRGGGKAYVRTLYPGQSLSLGETIFGQYEAWAVDIRPDQKLVVEHRITTVDRTTTLGVKVTLNYRVSDSYLVACLARDAVGGLHDRIVGSLADVMQTNDYSRIDERMCRSAASRVDASDLGIEITRVTLVEVDYAGPAQDEALHRRSLRQVEQQSELGMFQERADLAKQMLRDGYNVQKMLFEMKIKDAHDLSDKEQSMLLDVIRQTTNDDLRDGVITTDQAQQRISDAIDHLQTQKEKRMPRFAPVEPGRLPVFGPVDTPEQLLPTKELAPGKPEPAKNRPEDTRGKPVRFTSYYPREVQVGVKYGLFLYAHTLENTPAVDVDVRKFLEELGGNIPLPRQAKDTASILVGTPITVLVECEQLEFDPVSITKKWDGEWVRFDFDFRPDASVAEDVVTGRIAVMIYGIEIAQIKFVIEVMPLVTQPPICATPGRPDNPLENAKLRSVTTPMYERIFISYSRADKAVAESYRQAQLAAGNDVFIDTYSIRTGEDWQAALARAIDDSDIFQLFWSKSSASSHNVRAEWEYALLHKCPDDKCVGFIRPVYWRLPIPVAPPPELSHLNFRYVALSGQIQPEAK